MIRRGVVRQRRGDIQVVSKHTLRQRIVVYGIQSMLKVQTVNSATELQYETSKSLNYATLISHRQHKQTLHSNRVQKVVLQSTQQMISTLS